MTRKLLCSLFLSLICTWVSAQKEIDLNGDWKIIFDSKNEGKKARWMDPETFDQQSNSQYIQVPIAWETINQNYEGVAFYKKSFAVPQDWKDKVMRLKFGAVNYLAEVWLNGEVVGFHEGGFTSFEFRVDEMVNVGAINELTLRVVGPITLSDQIIDGIGRMETPQWRGGLSAGIWQDVSLEASGETYVDDIFIRPNIKNNTAKIQLTIDNTGIKNSPIKVHMSFFEKNAIDSRNKKSTGISKEESFTIQPGINKKEWVIEFPDAKYWSPESPNLYTANFSVFTGDEFSHASEVNFGMRELTIKDKDFFLNGKRIYIKGAFFEGLYPKGVAYPESEKMARKEIQLAKDAGFNMIRPWRRPPAPMWLDLADEMGIMVVGSPVLECMTLPISTPYLPKRVENEVRNSILRDRNRASIIQWELFNELHRPVLKQLIRPMAMVARELDPTRLILDESGGWAFGANMYLPNAFEPTKFNDIHNYPGPFINQFHYEGYLSVGLTDEEIHEKGYKGSKVGLNVVPGLMSYVSELGYGSLPDLDIVNTKFKEEGNPLLPAYRYHKRLAKEQEQVLIESGMKAIFPNMKSFYQAQQEIHGSANKRMLEAVRSNPNINGYCIHALAGGDWVLGAGLIDIWRNPKGAAYEGTKAANQSRIVTIRMFPRNVYSEKGTKILVTGINEKDKIKGTIHIEVVNAKGRAIFKKTLSSQWEEGISALYENDLNTKKWYGSYQLKVKFSDTEGQVITENIYSFDVFNTQNLMFKKQIVSVANLDSKLSTYLSEKGLEVREFDPKQILTIPILLHKSNEELSTKVLEFVQNGGNALYIGDQNGKDTSPENVPFSGTLHPARGLWTCIPHLVKSHPFFAGLPSNDAMRDTYENVWPTTTLRNLTMPLASRIEPIVASIGFDWFSATHELQYSGPGKSWWGSDLAEIQLGKGSIIVSQLRLLDNLGTDPVADKILSNMLNYFK